ncbi:MAG: tRNA preQ1(34) S-adenosylmethionine ribosyltransferase-isomerase QueA [Acidimicrobiales bacterium]|nr:tRNA preQ1(34) S-adenosylmethionine ribosyltransferase-isomerase QueA [Acidimicrobiales bacterium]
MPDPETSIDAFDYDLPAEAIAQQPVEPRDAARLLVDGGPEAGPAHRHVRDLPELLGPGDLLVVNDSRVRPARLALRKPTGAAVEVLLLDPLDGAGATWEALVRPGRRVRPGQVLLTAAPGDDAPVELVEVGDALGGGRRRVRLLRPEAEVLSHGEVPLPPYLHEPLADPERYQTVYAQRPTSVAAPTAGLHLTPDLLARCEAAGAAVARVELGVGIGTFQPITVDDVADHVVHTERFVVPEGTWAACQEARRVVAVGTTTVRALESAATLGRLSGPTDLYLRRGHRFAVVGAMLTNFHVPRSSLLVLVDAFVGARWRALYAAALAEGYRFLSLGDAMFLPGPPLAGPTSGRAR